MFILLLLLLLFGFRSGQVFAT